MRVISEERKITGEAGQGLLETVIALSVIITGLVGALALAVNNLSSTSDSGSRVIAGNLAREGVEVIRNIRDSNWLAGRIWYESMIETVDDHSAIVNFSPSQNEWILDFGPDTLGTAETQLSFDGGVYSHSGSGDGTVFSRLLTVDEICGEALPPPECEDGVCGEGVSCQKLVGTRVLSTVEWSERGRRRSITIEDRLYDWK